MARSLLSLGITASDNAQPWKDLAMQDYTQNSQHQIKICQMPKFANPLILTATKFFPDKRVIISDVMDKCEQKSHATRAMT